jgi:hypothetical protein
MKDFLRTVMLMLAALSLGCDPSTSPATSSAIGPHHATMIGLNDGKGFVELINEPEVTDRSNPRPTSIVAYFLSHAVSSTGRHGLARFSQALRS